MNECATQCQGCERWAWAPAAWIVRIVSAGPGLLLLGLEFQLLHLTVCGCAQVTNLCVPEYLICKMGLHRSSYFMRLL